MVHANDIIEQADEQVDEWRDYVRDAATLFHEREGQLFTRDEALAILTDELDIDDRVAASTLSALIGDTVDPVVQIAVGGERYIGVVEYEEFDGAYGYVNFDDVHGMQKRVVCAQCVHDAEYDSQVTHATSGDPNGSFSSDATYDELVDGIHRHYDDTHDVVPATVETGASLADPTTIGGNESFHKGNDGPNSGMNAEFLQGNTPLDITSNSPLYGGRSNDIVRSADGTESGFLACSRYEVQSGVTRTLSSGTFIVVAGDEIVIDGTIEGIGGGASGGQGGTSGSQTIEDSDKPGDDGSDGDYSGPGGDGGDSSSSGGVGGSDSSTPNTRTQILMQSSAEWHQNIIAMAAVSGGGGGGGGGGSGDESEDSDGGSGGDGGDGGPLIILISPRVEINGVVRASGQDGQDGEPPDDNNTNLGLAKGGGGGGGGSGGVIGILTGNLVESTPTKDVSGGSGGSGGDSFASSGANGSDGRVIETIWRE